MRFPGYARALQAATALDGGPVRHRAFWGGRGGAKSRSIAQALVLRAATGVERILCTREFQNSIRDSAKKIIDDVINREGLGVFGTGFFVSTEREIKGINGSLFTFMGLSGKADTIKSLEGYTLAWVEEAATVSQASIDSLIPTIRQEGSEIWWSWNPRYEDDAVDAMFRGPDGPPPGTILVECHAEDNPWFPNVLRRDMEYDRGRDPDKYAHIWRGQYQQNSEAKVFRNFKILPFETPPDAVLRFGADWGFSIDPTVLVRCFIGRWEGKPGTDTARAVADPDGRVLFIDREAYEVGCEIDHTPALFAGDDTGSLKPRWKNPDRQVGIEGANRWEIVADSARPETISYMKNRGFNITPAIKGPGSLEDGVEFLKSFDIVVHPDCVHVADELTLYRYKIDKKTGKVLPVLADKDNHTIDAVRYALESVRRAGSGKLVAKSGGQRAVITETEKSVRNLDEQQLGGKLPAPRARSAPSTRTGIM